MDTYGLIADGVALVEGQVEGRIRPFWWWIGGKTAAGVANPAPDGRQTTVQTSRLRTGVRRAIMRVIAHLFARRNRRLTNPVSGDPQ